MHLRGRYGHGGRPATTASGAREPERSGGGELIDQGMHLLDLTHWLAGPLPLHSALLRTQFWDTPVEDNAALILGEAAITHGSLGDAARQLDGVEEPVLARDLLPDGQAPGRRARPLLRAAAAAHLPHEPELGPPELEEIVYPGRIVSWRAEWEHFAEAIERGRWAAMLGDLDAARYAWTQVEAAYASGPYASMRESLDLAGGGRA